MKLSDKQIETAVNWWVQALKNPTFDAGGSREANGHLAWAEVLVARVHQEAHFELLNRFKENLYSELRRLDKLSYGYADLSVDYQPCGILYDAWVAAGGDGGSSMIFPWKTCMWFEHGGVQVRCGYTAEQEELLPAKRVLKLKAWLRTRIYYPIRWKLYRGLERIGEAGG